MKSSFQHMKTAEALLELADRQGCHTGGCYSGKGIRKRPGNGHSGVGEGRRAFLAGAGLVSLGRRSAGAAGDELQRTQWPDDIATEFLSHFGLLIASRNAMR
jgi:hypothetical protein